MSLTELTDDPCPECGALLDLQVVPPPGADPLPAEPGERRRRDTPLLTRLRVCPECSWTAPG